MLKGLNGKVAVVTGAAGGIGTATCERLASEGCRLVAADIEEGRAAELAKRLGNGAVGVGADISTPAGAAACVGAAVDNFGRLDLFHANAGIEGTAHMVVDLDIAVFDQVFAVNVRGAFLCGQAAVARFIEQGEGGGLLFTSSLASMMGTPSTAIYNASKHAVLGLVRCLARETPPGIRVNALAPGVVDTRMMRSLEESMGSAAGTDAVSFKQAMEQAVPMKRYALAEEIAATAAWILSDEVPYMHGETITIGGGLTP